MYRVTVGVLFIEKTMPTILMMGCLQRLSTFILHKSHHPIPWFARGITRLLPLPSMNDLRNCGYPFVVVRNPIASRGIVGGMEDEKMRLLLSVK